jgi:putative peptide zinc metalloprotease protein
MPESLLPARRLDLVISAFGDAGHHVVKDPLSGEYFHLGTEESFLLARLDGTHSAEAVEREFAEQFGRPLSVEEIEEFVALAEAQRFLRFDAEAVPAAQASTRQGILHWRFNLWNPDRALTRLAPKLAWIFTPWFAALSLGLIGAAAAEAAANADRLSGAVAASASWQTALLVCAALWAVTLLHELAHAAACKHFGGQVPEMGFLLLCLMPCLYTNVSDAWLFREKRKRIVVTLAGVWCELVLWAVSVFAWRLLPTGSLAGQVALAIAVACGLGTLLNFNPLLKLDGYYLLCDWLETPNLRPRAWEALRNEVRGRLLGRTRPPREKHHGWLLAYAAASALFVAAILSATAIGAVRAAMVVAV